jgi:hypothetical protein
MHAWKKGASATAAALLFLSGPIASAQSAPTAASKLSINHTGARAGTPAKHPAQIRGGFIIPVIAVVAIILGVVAFSGKEKPSSP